MEMIVLLVLLRAALLLHTAGSVRARSAATTVGRSLIESAVAALSAYAMAHLAWLGATQRQPGSEDAVKLNVDVDTLLPHLLIVAWVATTAVTGAMAERARLAAQLAVAAFVGAAVPIVGRIVHLIGGQGTQPPSVAVGLTLGAVVAAGTAAIILGARQGKYNRDGSANILPGHNLTLQLLGTLGLAFLLPHAIGLTGRDALTGLLLGTSAAVCGAAVWSGLRFGKVDVMLCGAAALSGAIAGAAAGALFWPWVGIVVGALLGVGTPWVTVQLDLRFRIDDPGGLVSPLGTALLSIVALFALSPLHGAPGSEVARTIGVLVGASLLLAAGVGIICVALKGADLLREHEDDEYEGLDLSRHDINAYPDFQQTMIKSYHLRQ